MNLIENKYPFRAVKLPTVFYRSSIGIRCVVSRDLMVCTARQGMTHNVSVITIHDIKIKTSVWNQEQIAKRYFNFFKFTHAFDKHHSILRFTKLPTFNNLLTLHTRLIGIILHQFTNKFELFSPLNWKLIEKCQKTIYYDFEQQKQNGQLVIIYNKFVLLNCSIMCCGNTEFLFKIFLDFQISFLFQRNGYLNNNFFSKTRI